jgi:uncharacterized membrane protein
LGTVNSLDARRLRNWTVVVGLTSTLAVIAISYPYLLARAAERFGERGVAVLLLGLFGATGLLQRRVIRLALRNGAAPASAIPLLLLATAVSGESVFLRLVPAAVFASLADMCRISLREGDSIIEHAVQYMVPEAPTFIRNYCRNLTWLWCGFFTGCALASACLAVSGDVGRWSRFTGSGIYATMAAVTFIEFFVRKTWFRYYFHEGPFDRLWSNLFPAEDTPRGRRSMAYIQSFRSRQGR